MKKSRIAERYRVEHEIGRGGMGRVLLVEDEALNRPLALKKVLPGASNLSRARFIDEARITAQLTHPNIVPVFHLGREADELFLTMRVVDGQDLRQILMGIRRADQNIVDAFPLRRLLRIFLKICDGVGYAHQRGILHRDLKPSNIMVGDQEEVLVMDWGLAKPIHLATQNQARQETQIVSRMREEHESESELVTQDGAVIGTPTYMSPEQASNDPSLDQQGDVYSLGAILYRLVTGYGPYEGGSFQVIKALLSRPPLAPRLRAPHKNIAPALEAIIQKAMKRDREQRYLSTGELREDLELYLDGERIDAYNEGFIESTMRFVRSYRVLAAALMSILGALVLSIFVLNQWSHSFRNTAKAKRLQSQINESKSQRSLFQIELAGRLAALNKDILELQSSAERFIDSCRSSIQPIESLVTERDQLRARFNNIDQGLQPLLTKQKTLDSQMKVALEKSASSKPSHNDSDDIEFFLKPLLQSNSKLRIRC
ncbi:MAG: serine/threonine-protein kinase, partial [Planctomycetota bacterium]|nr:serine/threonine-protein kinase [Planctomycetota bacterium]